MNFSLIFENTGDSLPCVALNPDILEYYVEEINQRGLNSFRLINHGIFSIPTHVDTLRSTIKKINSWLEPLTDVTFPVLEDQEYLDQDRLNYMHALWVRLQSYKVDIDQRRKMLNYSELIERIHDAYPDSERFPVLSDVIGKIGARQEFDSLNVPLIHGLEIKFDLLNFQCHEKWVEIPNPFPKTYVTFDVCNFYLPFNHLGRTQYNKFASYDYDYKHQDENTFNELLGFVDLNLRRPETKSYSMEYLEWCKATGREPSGELIPLGNIINLTQNLRQYRILVLNNILKRNNFQIHLTKG